MRTGMTGDFRRALRKLPREVGDWASGWVDAAESPDATPDSVTADAVPLRANLRGWFARKYRGSPQGEWRLVFQVRGDDEVYFLWLGPRGDDYKTAGRLARQVKNLRVV